MRTSAALFVLSALGLNLPGSGAFLNSGVGLKPYGSRLLRNSDCRANGLTRVVNARIALRTFDVSMVAASPAPLSLQSGPLRKALKKPSGALTVSVQYSPSVPMEEVAVQRLSTELRRQKACAIFASENVGILSLEQANAKGNFPGPVPIVSCAAIVSQSEIDLAKQHGASGILIKPWSSKDAAVDAASVENAVLLIQHAKSKGLEVVWEVYNSAQLDAAVAAGASILLLECSGGAAEAAALRSRIPTDRVALARVESMQDGNREADDALALRAAAFDGVLLTDACVGDEEDVEYVKWAAQALSSKASKEFRITGMTGHVNGHFGTGTFELSTAERRWRRRGGATDWAPASTNVAGRKTAAPP